MDSLDTTEVLASPLQVAWVITSRCNLSCAYCLEDAGDGRGRDEAASVRELIAGELVANRVLQVAISGGEPLIVPGLCGIVARMSGAGIAVRVTTNGTLVDAGGAASLVEAGVRVVEISVHPDSEFETARAAKLLIERGARVVIRLVVTTDNCDRVGSLAEPFLSEGVESVVMQEVVPLGRALEGRAGFPSIAALESLESVVRDMNAVWGDGRVKLQSVSLQERAAGGPTECSLSVETRKSCEIRPDGNVVPCSPAVALGIRNMIGEKGLARCWQDLGLLYGELAHEDLRGPCTSCTRNADCPGGCRALNMTAQAEPTILCRFYQPVG